MVAAKTSAATASHFSLAASLSFGFGLFGIAGFCWYFPILALDAPRTSSPCQGSQSTEILHLDILRLVIVYLHNKIWICVNNIIAFVASVL